MNITFALMLIAVIAQNPYCLHQDCQSMGYATGVMRYTCADFTHDSVLMLRHENITSYPMLGWVNHKYHAWLGIEMDGQFYNVEPQTNQLVYPSETEYVNGRRGVVRGLV